jgi:hypothetical protein
VRTTTTVKATIWVKTPETVVVAATKVGLLVSREVLVQSEGR